MNVNKKGFTIIELIMVIVIISILSLVLVPNIITFNNKNKIKSCESLEKNIISTAKIYVTNNKYDLCFDCSGEAKTILLQTLVDSGDLSSPITNPMTKDKIDLNKTITVTYDCTNKTFTYNFTLNCT